MIRLALVFFHIEVSAEIVTCEYAASVEFAVTDGTHIMLGRLLALTVKCVTLQQPFRFKAFLAMLT